MFIVGCIRKDVDSVRARVDLEILAARRGKLISFKVSAVSTFVVSSDKKSQEVRCGHACLFKILLQPGGWVCLSGSEDLNPDFAGLNPKVQELCVPTKAGSQNPCIL